MYRGACRVQEETTRPTGAAEATTSLRRPPDVRRKRVSNYDATRRVLRAEAVDTLLITLPYQKRQKSILSEWLPYAPIIFTSNAFKTPFFGQMEVGSRLPKQTVTDDRVSPPAAL